MTAQYTASAPVTVTDLQFRHPELPTEVAYDLLHFITDAERMGWVYNEDEEAARLLYDSTIPEDRD